MLTGEGPDAKLLNNATMKHGVYFGENEVQEAKMSVCFPMQMQKDSLAQMMWLE